MNNKKLIFRVKDGVAPSEVLPAAAMGEEGTGNIKVSRLYDIGSEVASFRGLESTTEKSANDDDLFDKEIYATKSESERKLYRTYVAEGSRDEAEALRAALKENENVEYVQYDEMNKMYFAPTDPLFKDLWGISKIGCPTAWDDTQGDEITVAVLDTGVDYNHPDIKDSMWKTRIPDGNGGTKEVFGKDFSDNDDDPIDYQGHGSHCAGTIAATINNNIGVVGVAPKAKIMAVKIFPNAYDSVCAAAIKYAADNGAKVLSNSWGPLNRRPSNQAIEDAVDYATEKGCIVVFAAGNEDDDVQYYSPANRPNVISVGATDQNDARAGFSNYGNSVTIAAPGVEILSLRTGTNLYVKMNGTSMACPHVAGLVALLLKLRKNLTFDQVKTILQNNGDVIQTDRPIGRRINAAKSVAAVSAAPQADSNGDDNSVVTNAETVNRTRAETF